MKAGTLLTATPKLHIGALLEQIGVIGIMRTVQLEALRKSAEADLPSWEACGGYEPQLMYDPETMLEVLACVAALRAALVATGISEVMVEAMLEDLENKSSSQTG